MRILLRNFKFPKAIFGRVPLNALEFNWKSISSEELNILFGIFPTKLL
jgi:hypothetical protein